MHFAHLALAGALAFAACGVGASDVRDNLPGDLIGSCLTEVNALSAANDSSGSQHFDLNKHCPQLAKRLARSLDTSAFGSINIDATSIEGLRDLQFFADGFDSRPAPAEKFRLNFDGLDALLSDVLIEKTIDDSLWERFLRWLEQYAKNGESVDFNRLVNWLEDIEPPPWLGEVILNTSVVLIVLLALMVVGNELRLAGVLRRIQRQRSVKMTGGTKGTTPKPRAASFDELRNLPARQWAAAVLQIVTAAFADRGWMSSSSSLTNGELVRQLGQRHSGVAGSFADLVDGIEKVIYGDRLPDDEARQRLVATASKLIELDGGSATVAPRGSR